MMGAVAIIPARRGSRRIPHKNRAIFRGKPIIEYSIDTAKATRLFDRIIVSTDDPDIADIAMNKGAWAIYRKDEYCQDHVGTQEVIAQCVQLISAPLTCAIYPTAPLMLAGDLERGYRMLQEQPERQFAMSVGTDPLQDAGQFYWGRTEAFIRRRELLAAHTIMIPIANNRVCDINTHEDWERALKMYAALHGGEE